MKRIYSIYTQAQGSVHRPYLPKESILVPLAASHKRLPGRQRKPCEAN
jgi:hypothetical protein